MKYKNDIDKEVQGKHFENMLSDLQEIAELSSRSIQLQAEILDLLKSDDPSVLKEIEEYEKESRELTEKICNMKIEFDKKYHTSNKEWEYDERIK